MVKEKINFHGKEMSLLEAKLYTCGLKLKIIKPKLIQEGEEYEYQMWKYRREERNKNAKEKVKSEIYTKLDKKDYLIEILNRKISLAEFKKKARYCEIHGHVEQKGSVYCPRCNSEYEQINTL